MAINPPPVALLKRQALWQGLTEDELTEIAGLFEGEKLHRGHQTYLAGEKGRGLFAVMEGIAKVVEESKGRESTIGIFPAGTYLDELTLFAPVFPRHFLEALTSVSLLIIKGAVFKNYLEGRPELSWRIMANMAKLAAHRMPPATACMQPLEIRLARYLFGLAQYSGVISYKGIVIDYPLQAGDIQVAIGGLEGETVQALRSLVARDVLDLSEELVITNLDQLEYIAYGQDPDLGPSA